LQPDTYGRDVGIVIRLGNKTKIINVRTLMEEGRRWYTKTDEQWKQRYGNSKKKKEMLEIKKPL
jgi:hypothetical protein